MIARAIAIVFVTAIFMRVSLIANDHDDMIDRYNFVAATVNVIVMPRGKHRCTVALVTHT